MTHHHHLFLHLLLLLHLLPPTPITSLCPQTQSSTLLSLKNSFNSSASLLSSWTPSTDCCTWSRVLCDPSLSFVSSLDLSNLSLSLPLSTILFSLTSLISLNLSSNTFNNTSIPDELANLSNLTSLNISNTGFIGPIPATLARLSRLVSLDLSSFLFNSKGPNSLSADPALFRNLSRLRELHLDGVNLMDGGRGWAWGLPVTLRVLSLSGCSISGPVDGALSRISSLEVLRLSQNNLSSVFPDSVVKIPSLRVLDVSFNPLLIGCLPEFGPDARLETLDVSNTGFHGELPESIGDLVFLTKLELSNCNFSGRIPSSLGQIAGLVHLDLSMNGFSGDIPAFSWPSAIAEITLFNNRLSGSIPSSFAGLLNLTKLDMRNNSLNGSVPSSLFGLPLLQILILGQNRFSGSLQEFTNQSTSLMTVDLSNNRLQGPVPRSVFFKLPGLKLLTLNSNNFSGTIELDVLMNLKNLSSLDLSGNSLSIEDGRANSTSISSFPQIGNLKLASCNLTRFPDFLKTQERMSTLDLSNNGIRGAIPKWIWNVGNGSLLYLNLSHNALTEIEQPLPDFSFSSRISVLDLHSNFLGGQIPLPPPSVLVLDYSSNNFISSIPANMSFYLNFTIYLSLSGNKLVGMIPSSICQASFLQVLDLSNNSLSGSVPECLCEMSNSLQVLNLGMNNLRGSLPKNITKDCRLRTIDFSRNRLEGRVPPGLVNCGNLEVLNLGNNNISDSFPSWLMKLSQLRVLVLRSNQLYGPVGNSQSNYTFPMLQIIDISSNNFNGSLQSCWFHHLKAMEVDNKERHDQLRHKLFQWTPVYYQDTVTVTIKGLEMTLVKVLTIFASLDLSNNHFEGEIPSMIGKLTALVFLNMSDNSLTGLIPQSIGNLMNLESLDLSDNKLSGEIPKQLGLLTFLSLLNLSYNNLEGQMPQGSQLRTFLNTSYEGNIGLCGPPLTKTCVNSVESPSVYESESRSTSELDWELIFIGLGFGGGLGAVVGPLFMWTTGRMRYHKFIDNLLLKMFPSSMLNCDHCGEMKVGAEDYMEEELMEMEVEGVPRFCVFCTQMDYIMGKPIHVECSCHVEE
ncbi:Receptor-like protein 12 [Acorus calamus]|uniref:Receptor-like protein 12 n=1 Tax=Acorus calamus TaxID=4465 RepID=A0AAV9C4U5_ACOCL|nr:Receptor-like protein 12 [Acorus calamus]